MFGIDDALILGPLIGSAIGGLTNKKDPLKGALLGGFGGAVMPGIGQPFSMPTGLMAEQAAAPVTNAAFSAGSSGLTTGVGAQVPSQGGLLGAMDTVKPYMEAAKTGMDVASQFKQEDTPIMPSPMTQNVAGNQTFAGLLSQMDNQSMQRRMEEQQRRMQRRRQIGAY